MVKPNFPIRYFLMPVILIIFFFAFYVIYIDIKDRTINEFNNEQLILARTASQGITSFFNDFQSNLTFLSQFKGIIDFSDDSKALMENFYENNNNIISAISRVDAHGVILFTYPNNQSVIGDTISNQEHVRKVIATHQPVISDVFMSVQGYLAIALHVPVFRENEFEGSLGILIPIDKLGKLYLGKIRIRGTGNVWLLSENGIEIYCPVSDHTGKSFLEITHNDPSAIQLLQKIKKETSGTTKSIHQEIIVNGKTIGNERYIVFYRTPLGNTYWTILISYQAKDIYNSLARLRNRLILVFSLLFITISYYFYSFAKVRNVLKAEAKRKKAEKSLQEGEEKFRKLFEAHTAVQLLIDTDSGAIIDANKSAAVYYGWSREELKRMKIDQINTLNPKALKEEIQNVISGKGVQFEFRHRLKDGLIRDVEVFTSKIKIGNKVLLHSIIHDISERKLVEQALRESESRFRKVVEQAPIAMAIVSMDGVIEFINNKVVEVFGYQPEDIPTMNKWWIQAYPDKDYRKKVIDEWTGRVQKAIKEETEIIGNEFLVTCKDGTLKTIFISGALVSNKIFVLFDDITERKKVEEALQESEERFSKAYKTSPISFMISEMKEGKIIEVNDAFTEISGYTREEALSGSSLKLNFWVHEEDRLHMINTLRSGKSVIRQETLLRAKNGDIYTVLLSAQLIQLGHKYCIISSIEDISERKKAEIELIKAKEHAEESDRLKTAFLQNMSHEIRTPMNAIMGFSSLLVENYNNKSKLEHFSEIINQRCTDLLKIINDILDISTIESGQLPIHKENCDLNELFTELTVFFKEHQKRIGKQHIHFELHTFCNPGEKNIITDKVKLRQIFINLIGNAFKFTTNGKIEGGCKYDANHHPVFYVSDTGIGIPSDKQDVIFQRFSQLNNYKNPSSGGTGLGLSIVKGLINLLGGKIWLESELENLDAGKAGGTTFYFSFPIQIAPIAYKEKVTMSETRKYHFQGKTILVVEDEQFNDAYIKEVLSKTELKIISTEYGKEAIRIATSQSPDIVLMDIRLPDMSGYDVTREIKKQKPDLKIIAQTAYASQEDKHKAIEAGCIDFISKPLNRELLLAMINKHLSKK